MKISGSFLTIQDDQNKITKLNEVTDYMHFDVMDGKFTSRPTLPFKEIIDKTTSVTNPKDIHLMVIDIKKYVDEVIKVKPEYITFHIEATFNPKDIIKYIKNKNVKVGLALNPETETKTIYKYLNQVDLVLVMSVHPGAGGQKFIDVTSKIKDLKKYRESNNLNYIIEIDGGINDETIKKVKDADLVVVGSYITNHDSFETQVNNLRRSLNE